jgi:predicted PurR-regulated permease PerM
MSVAKFEVPRLYIFTQTLMVGALLGILQLGLLTALLAVLAVYFLVEFGASRLGRFGVIPERGRIILLFLVGTVFGSLLALGILKIAAYISDGPESLVVLLQSMADTVDAARSHLPDWLMKYLPANIEEWQQAASRWLRENAGHFSLIGQEAGGFLIHLIFGAIIGGMVAINHRPMINPGPLAIALTERVEFLSTAFHRVILAQVKISALNTFLTGIFLVLALPLTGNPLPFTKIMIAVTFLVGMIPILGNLISNTVICLIALSVSPLAAVIALGFLVFIHKLEYFFNAHIIGTGIKARTWEVLLAMLIMESVFGLAGLIAAPIYYSYLKDDLAAQKLI